MNDNDELQNLINEIALKNGVPYDKSDPLMVLHTINRKIMDDALAKQKIFISEFESDIESIIENLVDVSEKKCTRLLNISNDLDEDRLNRFYRKIDNKFSTNVAECESIGNKIAATLKLFSLGFVSVLILFMVFLFFFVRV